ncbi:BTAD domain-containing putative transcriptional regulator [Saccharopolyspora sp. NPDC000359]|uniref:AfsR/SARP family transcriptional regulator n=1 Tax=Saccharopolyspora sp. NPDC000359 TaxID=3154251 RepID=UPI003322FDB0
MTTGVEGAHIRVLGRFECSYAGRRTSLPLGAQRLLALLALEPDGLHRAIAGEHLWPASSRNRAAGNLRSALWRARRIGGTTVIQCEGPRLRVAEGVGVDLHTARSLARKVMESPQAVELGHEELIDALSRELLPDWTDDWLVVAREQWEQIRLHALEGVARHLRGQRHYIGALKAALAAVAVEPIRESAHRIIMEVHADEGNTGSAIRHYQQYRALLLRELGVAPSDRITGLAHDLLP